MSNELTDHAVLMNWRILAYACGAAIIILAGAVLAWVVEPEGEERCSRACGEGRFLRWTAPVPQWMEQTPIGQRDVWHRACA